MDCEYLAKINHYRQIHKATVDYKTVNMTGPSHDPEFTVVVKINGKEYGTGTGKSKKEAKAVAAKETWKMIEKEQESPSNTAAAELRTTQTTSSPPPDKDYVSLLNTYSQRNCQMVDYPNKTRTGDAHAPIYSVSCTINGHVYGRGTGRSLVAAKQAAAKEAYEKVETEISNATCKSNSENSICFHDSAAKLEENMKDMAICEKPSPIQRNPRSSILQPIRLAANFANVRNKEEEKNMTDSNGSLPDMDTNTGEENGSPHTVNNTFLDLFEKIEPIDKGGYGTVFKATSKSDKTTYAIKRVKFTEKVEREAMGLANLTHENIVRYHCSWKGYDHIKNRDSSQNSDKETLCLFIQMEFCEQGTLETWITKNSENRQYHAMAQNKFLQIVKGVEYIHSKGLIHRDLKPQNIFISRDDKIKIGDFGLVTSVTFETQTEYKGTKSYMAPEQFGTKYGKDVDIYALGLIWCEILSAFTAHEKSRKIETMNGQLLSLLLSSLHSGARRVSTKSKPLQFSKMKTKVWSSIREGRLPESFTNRFPTEASTIKKMLSTSGRITISHLLDIVKSVDKEKAFKNYSC